MNWLNRFLLANWSWLMDGILLLMVLIIGIQVGESHVHKEWNAEKTKNAETVAKLEQHVEDVKLTQTQINQEISNDFLKKSKLLAERLPDPRFVGVCNIPTAGGRELPTVSEASARATPASTDPLPTPSGNALVVSYEQLSKDAAQTTLMLVELQRWYRAQSVIEP
jgi:hypothetical protein